MPSRLTVRNAETLRHGVRTVLAGAFDRVVPGHGDVVESGGKAAVADGCCWLWK